MSMKKRFRDTITGYFVTKAEADVRPETTISESVRADDPRLREVVAELHAAQEERDQALETLAFETEMVIRDFIVRGVSIEKFHDAPTVALRRMRKRPL